MVNLFSLLLRNGVVEFDENVKKKKLFIEFVVDVDVVVGGMITECVVCESLIGTLQGISTDVRGLETLNRILFDSCDVLPKKYYEVCINVIQQLAPQIEAIPRMIPASYICHKLNNICSGYYNYKVDFLSSENCNNGPDFWCISTTNAATCGTTAIEYCQKYIWKGTKPNKSSFVVSQ